MLARTWEDPLGAAWARVGKGASAGTKEPSGARGEDDALPVRMRADEGDPDPDCDRHLTVIAVQMSDALTVEGEEDRMNCRVAAVAALQRLGYVQSPGSLGRIAFLTPRADRDSEGNALDGILAYEWWVEHQVSRGHGVPARAILLIYLTPGGMAAGPSRWFGDEPDWTGELPESAGLLSRVHAICNRAARSPQECPGLIPRHVLVLRRSTEALRADLQEWAHSGHNGLSRVLADPERQRFSCFNFSATGDLSSLVGTRPDSANRFAPPKAGVEDWIDRLLQDPPAPARGDWFRRVVGSDTILLRSLVKELRLRHIDPHDLDNAIAIIHERDTAFGRAWADSLREALIEDAFAHEALDAMDADERDNIIDIGFLRAIDGDTLSVPRRDAREQGPAARRSGRMAPEDSGPSVSSAGQPQFDYVLRSLRQCQTRLDPSGDRVLRAVFVGASDEWDAFPLIQLIRQNFPDVLILTSSLNAQFEDPSQYLLMRNVVVASPIGLSCHSVLQGNIPAFRDPYQSGLFVGVLQGLAIDNPESIADLLLPARPVHAQDDTVDYRPALVKLLSGETLPMGRVYEISKRGAIDLAPLEDERAKLPGDGLFFRETFRPSLIAFGATTSGRTILLGTGLASCVVFVLSLFIRTARDQADSAHVFRVVLATYAATVLTFVLLVVFLISSQTLDRAVHLILYMILAFAASVASLCVAWSWITREGLKVRTPGVPLNPWHSLHQWGFRAMGGVWTLICICIYVVAKGSGRDGEPFFWDNGVSAWCPELIRIVIIVLTVIFFYQYHRMVLVAYSLPILPTLGTRAGWKRLAATFWENYSIIAWPERAWNGNVDALQLRSDLHARLHPLRVIRRVGLLAVPFVLGTLSALHFVGPVRHNVRGAEAGVIDLLLTIGILIAVNAVVFFVWDASRVHTRYILNLAQHRSDWGMEELRAAAIRTNLPPSLAGSLLDVEDIARRTAAINALIYWPVALIMLSVLSLHPIFDRWPSGSALNVAFGVSLALAVFAGFRLRRAAELARGHEIDRLEYELTRVLSPAAQTRPRWAEARAQQVLRLIENIKSLREGAFAPWTDDPLFRAICLPLIGFATVHAADWATRFFSR